MRVKRARSGDSCASLKAEEHPYSVRGCWTRYEGCSVECTSTRSRNCFTPWREREWERKRKGENESPVLPLSPTHPLPLNLFRLYPRSHSRFILTRRHPQRAYHAPLMPNRLTSRMIILLPHAPLPPSALIRAALIVIFSVPIPEAEAISPRFFTSSRNWSTR